MHRYRNLVAAIIAIVAAAALTTGALAAKPSGATLTSRFRPPRR